MRLDLLSKSLAARVLAATVLLALVSGVAGPHLAPKARLSQVLLYSALGAVALLVLLMAVAVLRLTLSQFVLRKGGTDAQWFWFRAEPPGLVDLRKQARDAQSPASMAPHSTTGDLD